MGFMIRKTKFWVILFACIFLLGAGGFFLLRSAGGTGSATARVWLDGEIIREIDLGSVVIPYEFDITTELGTNRVRVEHGSIQVVSADCPDQVCVRTGRITQAGETIVCLPAEMALEILPGEESDGQVDAVAG